MCGVLFSRESSTQHVTMIACRLSAEQQRLYTAFTAYALEAIHTKVFISEAQLVDGHTIAVKILNHPRLLGRHLDALNLSEAGENEGAQGENRERDLSTPPARVERTDDK